MALEIKTASSVNFNVNNNFSFSYDGMVQQFLLGFQNFDLSYGSDDHHVEIASVSFGSVSKVGNTVSGTVVGQLQDASGDTIDNYSSSAVVAGIAWVGATPNDATAQLLPSFASGTQSNQIALTGPNPTVLVPAMAGFYVTYGSEDHHVETFTLTMYPTSNGSEATVGGTLSLSDASGHTASAATITPGLLAGTGTGRGFVAVTQSTTTQNNSITVDFSSAIEADLNVASLAGYNVTITGVAAMINGFNIIYPYGKDHHVKVISVGCWGGVSPSTTSPLQYTASNVGAWMYDDSGNNSDPTNSTVTMAFVATYTATPK